VKRRKVKFTVDAALLRELGARLVGKPQIALSELIKNAYDADARHVVVTFDEDSIVIEDDGHGMSARTFEQYWMRVGTTHKAIERESPELGRPLTGSKGVGRLAAQLLAAHLTIESVALVNPALSGFAKRSKARANQLHELLTANIAWDAAVNSAQLTQVEVPITEGGTKVTFAHGSKVGTRLTLTDLASDWDEDSFRALAREIWALQPPFEVDADDERAFEIELVSDYGDIVTEFSQQMQAIFDAWQGRIEIRLRPDDPDTDVLFDFDPLDDFDEDDPVGPEDESSDDEQSGSRPRTKQKTSRRLGVTKLLEVDITLRRPHDVRHKQLIRVHNCPVDEMTSDILIFNLRNRQAHGIAVAEARDYMRIFGGVHIYDDNFRLPYYGPEDWLDIERDHARRLSRSQLLPERLRIARGMQDLPSRRNVFGTTTVSTARERQTASARNMTETEALATQVSRDRLNDNIGFVGLRRIVRLGFDLYATEVARAKARKPVRPEGASPQPRPTGDLRALRQAIDAARSRLSAEQYESMTDYLDAAEAHARSLTSGADAQATLFGSLATVGMTTLAWEHEATKQRLVVLDAAGALSRAARGDEGRLRETAVSQATRLSDAARRMNDVARLFRPLLDGESRDTRVSLNVKRFVKRTVKQLSVLGRGAEVKVGDISTDLTFPPGTFSSWSAIFQNLLVNAYNAVLEEPTREVLIDAGSDDKTAWLRIQDTGIGIDLERAESYFEPFKRGMDDDPRRAQLGLGGSGLGLTIVRMLADPMGVTVRFTEPEAGFSTAAIVEWGTNG
jgi:signal transduction histidine kinase